MIIRDAPVQEKHALPGYAKAISLEATSHRILHKHFWSKLCSTHFLRDSSFDRPASS